MVEEEHRARAATFRALHEDSEPLVLPCAWDAASARLFESVGFPAVGTTSAGVANALGYPDGQRAPVEEVIDATGRIAGAVSVPVSADLESGYGESVAVVVDNVRAAVAAGAVGLNLEDGSWPDADPLVDPSVMGEAIAAIRKLEGGGAAPFVNARTDVYLRRVGDEAGRFDRAVERAAAYRDAGADCLFVPGVEDPETIGRLVAAIDGPLNVLASHPGPPPVAELGELGVARVSVGPGPMYAAMGTLRRGAEELLEDGTYPYSGAIPYPEMQGLLADGSG